MTSVPFLLAALLFTNAADVASHRLASRECFGFALEAVVSTPPKPGTGFFVQDASGAIGLGDGTADNRARLLKPGDVVRLTGTTEHFQYGVQFPRCTSISVVGHVPAPEPILTDIAALRTGRHDNRPVRLQGTVKELFTDEIDPNWILLVLSDGNDSLYVAFFHKGRISDDLLTLVDAKVEITGVCTYLSNGFRLGIGRLVLADESAIRTLRASPADPFDVPPFAGYGYLHDPDAFSTMGSRRISGRTLAVWGGNRLLLSEENGTHFVELSEGPLPAPDDLIEIVGTPETDLYRVNFSNARWRPAAGDGKPYAPKATAIAAADILTDGRGHPRLNQEFFARTVRLTGIVNDILAPRNSHEATIFVKDGEFSVPVDVSANRAVLDRLAVGCRVEVTGVCVILTEPWHSYSRFPRTTGLLVVPRTADGVRVLARPPWWTPGRLLVLVGSLLAALVAIGVWNRVLKHLVDRRGRELFREQIARAGSEMRIEERTRLAVELHDSISQNLTGVSMQINAAERFIDKSRDKTLSHLDIASRTLDSCREELKNCIWDLRNQSLDEADMNEAIRKTVETHIEDARLFVRFNVPRTRFSDNTAHAILRIIRELATNAVRHGQARTIRVAGATEDGNLLFSVTDDGLGFDPENRPGMAEGHFGLQGIQERLRPLHGHLTIDSAPGKGTRATVVIPIRPGEPHHG